MHRLGRAVSATQGEMIQDIFMQHEQQQAVIQQGELQHDPAEDAADDQLQNIISYRIMIKITGCFKIMSPRV